MKLVILSILLTFLTQASDFEFSLGAQSSSLLYKRGIITHKGFHLAPFISINVPKWNLLFAGSSLYHKLEFTEKFHLRSQLHFNSTNDEPLFYVNEKEEDRIRRDETNELNLFFQYDFTKSSYARIQYSKDLKAHKGNYFEFEGRIDFFNNDKGFLNPGLFASIGHGDDKHNEYLYGLGANGSVSNYEYGFSIVSPRAIESFWPTLKITRFHILGDENKKAAYVKEVKGFSIEALVAFRVW